VFTDQPLYRARAFEPVAAIGDVVMLLDQTGPIQKYTSPFFVVRGIEPVWGPNPHGVVLLWSQAAAAPAGYGTAPGNTALIPEAQTGNINNGSFVQVSNPKVLQGFYQQLVQLRWALRPLALTGIKEHDLELRVYMPGKLGKFGLFNAAPGYFNMADQFQDPADAIDSPAQNANQTLPAAFPAVHARDQANLTEMFIWEVNGPTFEIWNNGTAALTAGAIGLRVWGYRYDLAPLDASAPLSESRWIYGQLWKVPPTGSRIPVIPTAPYVAQPGQQ